MFVQMLNVKAMPFYNNQILKTLPQQLLLKVLLFWVENVLIGWAGDEIDSQTGIKLQ